jgi:hypothetical protein
MVRKQAAGKEDQTDALEDPLDNDPEEFQTLVRRLVKKRSRNWVVKLIRAARSLGISPQ